MEPVRVLMTVHRRVISELLDGKKEWPERERDRYHDGTEKDRRAASPECDSECRAVRDELVRRNPDAVEAFGRDSTIYDFTGQPDLLERWMRALDLAKAAWLASLPQLPVKTGDFIMLEGRVLRVGAVDLVRRTITTQVLDAAGGVRGSIPNVRAEKLSPIEAPVKLDLGWSRPPDDVQDAYARARWGLRDHLGLLVRAGLVDDDD